MFVGFLSLNAQHDHCEDFDINLSSNGILCGETYGEIWIDIIGGQTGIYEVEWCSSSRRVEGSNTTFNDFDEIVSLKAGLYTVKVTDFRTRCSVQKKFELKTGALPKELTIEAAPANCKGVGYIMVNVPNYKKPPYRLTLTGQDTDANYVAYQNSFRIYNVPSGDYELSFLEEDCVGSRTINVPTAPGLPSFTLEDEKDECGVSSGNVIMRVTDGVPGYKVTIDGPVSGSIEVPDPAFRISPLTTGDYKITLEDANGCLTYGYITLDLEGLDIELTGTNAGCENGSLKVNISNGTGPFTISYEGPINKTEVVDSRYNTLHTPAGTYWVEVTDANGCTVKKGLSIAAETCHRLGVPVDNSLGNHLENGNEVLTLQTKNYPNPFVHQTNIIIDLPEASYTTITVHDNIGKVVQTHAANYDKGSNLFIFNQNNLTAGIYYYTVRAGKHTATNKMIIR